MNELEQARSRIQEIDRSMAELFSQRMACSEAIAAYKQEHGLPIRDEAREKTLMEKNCQALEHSDLAPYYLSFLRHTIDLSCRYQAELLGRMPECCHIERGSLGRCASLLGLHGKVFLVTDTGVPASYAEAVAAQCLIVHVERIPAGEDSKSPKMLEALWKAMMDFGLDRQDSVVAVGGGVVGDLAGFAASCYMRGVDFFVGNMMFSGVLVSVLSFSASGCVLYKLLRLDMPVGDCLRCMKFLLIFPAAFFFALPMSESLFFLLSVSCVYLARKKKWLAACAVGALAAFTRSLGLVLIVPVLMEFIHECVNGRERAWKVISVLIIPLGFAAYCYVNYTVSGDPFKFMQYQAEHWGQHLGMFFNTAAYQTQNAVSAARENNYVNLFGLWLPNLIMSFAALILVGVAANRLRSSYTAWFIAYYAVAIGATWLLSAPRYLAAMPVLPLSMAVIGRKRGADLLLTALCALCFAGYMLVFTLRWQVW